MFVVRFVSVLCVIQYMQKKNAAQTCTTASQEYGQIFIGSDREVIRSIFMAHIFKTPQRCQYLFVCLFFTSEASRPIDLLFFVIIPWLGAKKKKEKKETILWLDFEMPEDIKP